MEGSNTYKAGSILRVLGWINIVLTGLLGLALTVPFMVTQTPAPAGLSITAVAVIVMLLLSSIYLWVGRALQRHRDWARVVALLLALLSLLNVPLGTVIGVLILYFLIRGWSEPTPA